VQIGRLAPALDQAFVPLLPGLEDWAADRPRLKVSAGAWLAAPAIYLVSIIHLTFYRRIPLFREIESYQRHRTKAHAAGGPRTLTRAACRGDKAGEVQNQREMLGMPGDLGPG
jgi:hypothetical protein